MYRRIDCLSQRYCLKQYCHHCSVCPSLRQKNRKGIGVYFPPNAATRINARRNPGKVCLIRCASLLSEKNGRKIGMLSPNFRCSDKDSTAIRGDRLFGRASLCQKTTYEATHKVFLMICPPEAGTPPQAASQWAPNSSQFLLFWCGAQTT